MEAAGRGIRDAGQRRRAKATGQIVRRINVVIPQVMQAEESKAEQKADASAKRCVEHSPRPGKALRRSCLLHQAGRGGAHAGRKIIQRKGSQCVGNICCALWGGVGRNNAQNMGICRVQNGNLVF